MVEVVLEAVESCYLRVFDRVQEPRLNSSTDRMNFINEDKCLPNSDARTAALCGNFLIFNEFVNQLLWFTKIDSVEEDLIFSQQLLTDRSREGALTDSSRTDKKLVRKPLVPG